MKNGVRTKVEMGNRALDFSKANPSPDAGYGQLVLRLEDATGRAAALITQQRAGSIAAEAATERRGEIRLQLHDNLLRHLVVVGKDVAKEVPGLKQHFKLPPINATNLDYLNAAQAMYDEAVAERERFIRHGLADALIDDLGAALKEYDGAVKGGNGGRAERVAAVAELSAVAEEIMNLVRMMDGFNRYRFRADVARRAAWKSVKNVIGPSRAVTPLGDGTAPVPKPGGTAEGAA